MLSDKPLSIFVDFDSIDGIVGVSPCHFQARTRIAVLTQTYEQRTPPAVVQGAAPDSSKSFTYKTIKARFGPWL